MKIYVSNIMTLCFQNSYPSAYPITKRKIRRQFYSDLGVLSLIKSKLEIWILKLRIVDLDIFLDLILIGILLVNMLNVYAKEHDLDQDHLKEHLYADG